MICMSYSWAVISSTERVFGHSWCNSSWELHTSLKSYLFKPSTKCRLLIGIFLYYFIKKKIYIHSGNIIILNRLAIDITSNVRSDNVPLKFIITRFQRSNSKIMTRTHPGRRHRHCKINRADKKVWIDTKRAFRTYKPLKYSWNNNRIILWQTFDALARYKSLRFLDFDRWLCIVKIV